jgi:hypothetical protein
MKTPESLKNMSIVEIMVFIAFVLYIVLPITIPSSMKPFVNSSMGLVFFFCVTVILFVFTNPILGVLYILVVYETIRRSSETVSNSRSIVMEYQPSQATKDMTLQKMNPAPSEKTVEEEVIEARAPINKSHSVDLVHTTFKPVMMAMDGASKY